MFLVQCCVVRKARNIRPRPGPGLSPTPIYDRAGCFFIRLDLRKTFELEYFGRVEGLINKHSSRRLRIQGLLSLWRWQQQRCISLYLCSGEEEAQGATGEREEQVG